MNIEKPFSWSSFIVVSKSFQFNLVLVSLRASTFQRASSSSRFFNTSLLAIRLSFLPIGIYTSARFMFDCCDLVLHLFGREVQILTKPLKEANRCNSLKLINEIKKKKIADIFISECDVFYIASRIPIIHKKKIHSGMSSHQKIDFQTAHSYTLL